MEKSWRAIKVNGPLAFSLTGILSTILGPLAESAIPVFVISTYDTNYILVKEEKLNDALLVLNQFSHGA